jgi:hypothetical protein
MGLVARFLASFGMSARRRRCGVVCPICPASEQGCVEAAHYILAVDVLTSWVQGDHIEHWEDNAYLADPVPRDTAMVLHATSFRLVNGQSTHMIMAFILALRITNNIYKVTLPKILCIAFLIAHKMLEDRAHQNSFFLRCCDIGLTMQDVNAMELELMGELEYSTLVAPRLVEMTRVALQNVDAELWRKDLGYRWAVYEVYTSNIRPNIYAGLDASIR